MSTESRKEMRARMKAEMIARINALPGDFTLDARAVMCEFRENTLTRVRIRRKVGLGVVKRGGEEPDGSL